MNTLCVAHSCWCNVFICTILKSQAGVMHGQSCRCFLGTEIILEKRKMIIFIKNSPLILFLLSFSLSLSCFVLEHHIFYAMIAINFFASLLTEGQHGECVGHCSVKADARTVETCRLDKLPAFQLTGRCATLNISKSVKALFGVGPLAKHYPTIA